MRARHTIVELIDLDDAPSPGWFETPEADLSDELELIDESVAPRPILSNELSSHAGRPTSRPARSAVPASQPMSQQRSTMAWGLGTDGWPRYNSRLVRLFASEPGELIAAVAGQNWGPLRLEGAWRPAKTSHRPAGAWPLVVDGTMQMPYRSPALEVELHVQPFGDRYARVDVILKSRHRWPRQYFDVASRCLTRMQRLERGPFVGQEVADFATV